jgi:hypothetical protein
MNNKRTSSQFADLTSLGLLSVFIGIGALLSFSKPVISFLSGMFGIIFGIVSLHYSKQEKLEIVLAWFGIILSVVSIATLIFRYFSY